MYKKNNGPKGYTKTLAETYDQKCLLTENYHYFIASLYTNIFFIKCYKKTVINYGEVGPNLTFYAKLSCHDLVINNVMCKT